MPYNLSAITGEHPEWFGLVIQGATGQQPGFVSCDPETKREAENYYRRIYAEQQRILQLARVHDLLEISDRLFKEVNCGDGEAWNGHIIALRAIVTAAR